MEKYSWAILGPGRIAGNFAKSLKLLPRAELTAVASRSEERAQKFAADHGFDRFYGNYEKLAEDERVDIVYIATTNDRHFEQALLCLEAGKAVLCEKPLALNSRQVTKLIETARKTGTFLMEAMWTRFLPAHLKTRELLASGVIGEVGMVKSDFGFSCSYDPQGRQFNRNRGGGALLDLGIYPLAFALDVLGNAPDVVRSTCAAGETGVDLSNGIVMKYGKKLAQLTSTFLVSTSQDAWIYGKKGYIHIPDFWKASEVKLQLDSGREERFDCSFDGPGYQYEAEEVMGCLDRGQRESSLMSHKDSLAVHTLMDGLRSDWGISYPEDKS